MAFFGLASGDGHHGETQILEFHCTGHAESGHRLKFSEKAISGHTDRKGPANDVFREGLQGTRMGPESAVWIDWVEVEWPFQPAQPTKVMGDVQGQLERFGKNETDPRQFLTTFATKALRGRQIAPEFLDKLVAIYEARSKEGAKPLDPHKEPLPLLLASPRFLYLAEPAAAGGDQRGTAILAVSVTDHRLEACAPFRGRHRMGNLPHRNTATLKRPKVS